MMQPKKTKVTIDIDLLFKIWKTRRPNQDLDSRILELIKTGIEVQEANAQLNMLIAEGKIKAPPGDFKE